MHFQILAAGALLIGSIFCQQGNGQRHERDGTDWSRSTSPYSAQADGDSSEPFADGMLSGNSSGPPGHGTSWTTHATAHTETSNGLTNLTTPTHSTSSGLPSTASPPTPTVGAPLSTTSGTCNGATLNVMGATLNWWYPQTYTWAVSTFDIQLNSNGSITGWTLRPASTTFNVASAVASPTCTSDLAINSARNASSDTVRCTSTPAPVAAATTVIPQIAYTTLNATTGKGQLPDVVVTPAPAAITIPGAGGTFLAGTPFVYFSKYEIMSRRPTTLDDGSTGCMDVTSVHNMTEPFSFEYFGENVNDQKAVGAGVTGDVNPAFLGVVGATNAVAGSWVAAPTVAIVLEKVYAAQETLGAVTEITASGLETPTPTLPPFLVPQGPVPANTISMTGPAAQLETTETYLELPTPPPRTATPTTEAPTIGHPPATLGLGGLISAIISAAQPTNAAQVLSYALDSSPGNRATGDAMASGTHGASPPRMGGGAAPATPAGAPAPQQIITIGQSTITANAMPAFIIDGSTILPGGQPVTVDGKTIAIPASKNVVVIDGSTMTLSGSMTASQIFDVNDVQFTATPAPLFRIGGQTLQAGGPAITVDGTRLSLAPGASAVVIGSSVSPLAAATAPFPPLTIDGRRYSAVALGPGSASGYVVGTQTLTRGGAITMSDAAGGVETVSLDAAGAALVEMADGRTSTSFLSSAGIESAAATADATAVSSGFGASATGSAAVQAHLSDASPSSIAWPSAGAAAVALVSLALATLL